MAREPLILDRYEPLGTAGAGGFGTVRIAWDPRIQRKVAIKTIQLSEADAQRAGLPGADAVGGSTADRWHGVQPWNEFLEEDGSGAVASATPEPVTSLAHIPGLDEARTAAKLTDSRIVGVYDFEVRGQVAYLIMEYVEGITLTRLLADYEDCLTLDVIAAVFDAVAGALSVAHKAGVLHLDIKPDNILINVDGQAKVTDFGLATLADAAGTGTAGGGTIGYMPLEQMRREPQDARTDEWALASVLYEALTGDNPFHAPSLDDAAAAIEGAELVLPSLCWDDIDEGIDDVVFKALDPEPGRRYANVKEFARAADRFLGDAVEGERQLAAVVADALGLGEDEEDVAEEDAVPRGPALMARVGSWAGDWLGERFSGRWLWLAGKVLVTVLVAYLGYFAASRLYGMVPLLGRDAGGAVAAVSAVVVAVVEAVWPPVGVLVACVLAGIAFAAADLALVGIAIAVAALAWLYAWLRLAADHPVLLRVVVAVLVVALVAVLALVPVPADYLPPAIIAICALAASALAP